MAETFQSNVGSLAASLPNDNFLHPVNVVSMLDELIPQQLVWDSWIPVVNIPVKEFSYLVDSVSGTRKSPLEDPRKRWPVEMTADSSFPRMTVSPIETRRGFTTKRGFAFTANEDVQGQYEAQIVDWIDRVASRQMLFFLEQINSQTVTSLTNDFSVTNTDDTAMEDYMEHSTDFGTETTIGNLAGKLDSTYYWDEEDANPVTDITDLKAVFDDQNGYSYNLDRIWMPLKELHFINKFVVENGGSWQQSPLGDGYNTNMIAGVTLTGLKNAAGFPTTVGDGYIIGGDSTRPAGTTYATVDRINPSTANGMNWRSDIDPETGAFNYRLWNRRETVVTEPKAIAVLQVRD